MNTQAHLLLAAALLCKLSIDRDNAAALQGHGAQAAWYTNLAILLGALIPDASLFIMFGLARLRGISHEVIWGDLYYSAYWQNIGAITNSIPLYLSVAALGYFLCRYNKAVGAVLLGLGLAAALHCALDLPLHVDDGHAHFWPFSGWVYASPVSYWDTNHYGHYWQPIEFIIACVCTFVLWRRFSSTWVRIASTTALLSYPVMLAFWLSFAP